MSDESLPKVAAVERAMRLLGAFSVTRSEMGLSELAKAAGLPKATAYRLASTLEQGHFLERNPEHNRYTVGLRLIALGSIALGRLGLGDHLLPYMRDLAQQCGETVNLALLVDGEVTYINRVRPAKPLAIDLAIGTRAPANATALGKVLLAYLPDAELQAIMQRRGLPARTAKTVTEPALLRTQLAAIRNQGYALDYGEFADGVHCVGAPIFDHAGQAIASMAVSGPAFRLQGERLAAAGDALLATVRAISHVLGAPERSSSQAGVDATASCQEGCDSSA